MTRIGTSLGGSGQQGAPQPGGEWRQPQQYTRAPGIDWTQEQFRTPHPSRAQRYGSRRGVRPVADVPELPERTIAVRAKGRATYYTAEGEPIAGDQWTTLPISPGLIQAIKDGNLERGPDQTTQPLPPHRPRHAAE